MGNEEVRKGKEGKTRACASRRFIEPRRGAVGGLVVVVGRWWWRRWWWWRWRRRRWRRRGTARAGERDGASRWAADERKRAKAEGRGETHRSSGREQGRKKDISVIGANERDTSRARREIRVGRREEARSSGRTRKERRSSPVGASERPRELWIERTKDGTYRSGWISSEESETLRCDGERWNAAGERDGPRTARREGGESREMRDGGEARWSRRGGREGRCRRAVAVAPGPR